MMRNTSPIGWLPLLAIKVFKDGAFIPFLTSGIFVALPLIIACIWLDTIYYGSDKFVLTGYNFFKINLEEGLSKYFGEDPWWFYFVKGGFGIFTLIYPIVLFSTFFTHIKT